MLGCELEDAHPVTQDSVTLWWTIAAAESFAVEAWLLNRADLIAPDSLRTIRMGEGISARKYLDAQNARSEFTRTWALFLERFDFIVSPGEQVLPFPVDQSEPSRNGEVAEGDWWGMDSVANLTGQPATSVPTGLSDDGLQVAAAFQTLACGPLAHPPIISRN